jgi:hypothetical protein
MIGTRLTVINAVFEVITSQPPDKEGKVMMQ